MKKIIIVIALFSLLFGSQATAQKEMRSVLSKGALLVGGNFALKLGNQNYVYSSQTDKYTSNVLNFNPQVGFFATQGFALGVSLDLETAASKSTKANYKDEYSSNKYLIGPFIRYYTKSNIFFFGSSEFGKMVFKNTSSSGSSKTETTITQFKIGAGYAIFLNDHVTFEPTLSYQSLALKSGTITFTDRTNQFVLGAGFSIFLAPKDKADSK